MLRLKSFSVFILLVLFTSTLMTSCKKKVQGCMDMDADNYNYLAEEDDGTCYFSGGAVFYHKLATSQYMLDNGIAYSKIYVDGSYKGSLSANTHWTFIPSCTSETAVTIENYGLAYEKFKQFNYQVKDNNGVLLNTGTFQIKANSCEVIEIVL
jgi:hypothetical protein